MKLGSEFSSEKCLHTLTKAKFPLFICGVEYVRDVFTFLEWNNERVV